MPDKLYSFRETPKFTKDVIELLPDEDYSALQFKLIKKPDAGDLIVGSGGLRKIRWAAKYKGKRGGVRVIYYWADEKNYIFMLAIYAKNELADLSKEDISHLRDKVKEWLI